MKKKFSIHLFPLKMTELWHLRNCEFYSTFFIIPLINESLKWFLEGSSHLLNESLICFFGVLGNKELLPSTVPVNKELLTSTVLVNKELFTVTLPVNKVCAGE